MLLGISDPYTAWCFDSACGEFGRALENELSNVEGKNKKEVSVKSERIMRKWLEMPAKYRNPPGATTGKRSQAEVLSGSGESS